jgi:hypothetical protein
MLRYIRLLYLEHLLSLVSKVKDHFFINFSFFQINSEYIKTRFLYKILRHFYGTIEVLIKKSNKMMYINCKFKIEFRYY